MNTPAERARQLTVAHWAYVGKTLELHGVTADELARIRHHYLTSGQHFYLHAVEDCENNMFNMFAEEVDEVAMEAELDRSCGDPAQDAIHVNRAVTRLSKCLTCYDHKQCGGGLINAKGDCLHHRPKPKAERKASLCHSCHAVICSKEFIAACEESGTCANYTPALRERMLDAKQDTPTAAERPAPHTDPAVNCKDCSDVRCIDIGKNVTRDMGCIWFKHKEATK